MALVAGLNHNLEHVARVKLSDRVEAETKGSRLGSLKAPAQTSDPLALNCTDIWLPYNHRLPLVMCMVNFAFVSVLLCGALCMAASSD